ncbi:hypothetical protein MRX96_015670 [Rhipicephalus microplus]
MGSSPGAPLIAPLAESAVFKRAVSPRADPKTSSALAFRTDPASRPQNPASSPSLVDPTSSIPFPPTPLYFSAASLLPGSAKDVPRTDVTLGPPLPSQRSVATQRSARQELGPSAPTIHNWAAGGWNPSVCALVLSETRFEVNVVVVGGGGLVE